MQQSLDESDRQADHGIVPPRHEMRKGGGPALVAALITGGALIVALTAVGVLAAGSALDGVAFPLPR